MPEQVFRAVGRFRSGKTRNLKIRLINFRGDPDDPEDLEKARAIANHLTPRNVEILADGFEMVMDNPNENLGINSVEDLASRDIDTIRGTGKTIQRRTPTGGLDGPTNSTTQPATKDDRQDREDTGGRNRQGDEAAAEGSDQVDLASEQSQGAQQRGQSARNKNR